MSSAANGPCPSHPPMIYKRLPICQHTMSQIEMDTYELVLLYAHCVPVVARLLAWLTSANSSSQCQTLVDCNGSSCHRILQRCRVYCYKVWLYGSWFEVFGIRRYLYYHYWPKDFHCRSGLKWYSRGLLLQQLACHLANCSLCLRLQGSIWVAWAASCWRLGSRDHLVNCCCDPCMTENGSRLMSCYFW